MADEYLTIDGHKLDDVEDISKQKGTPLITDLVLVVELNDDGKTVSKAKYYSVNDLIKSLGSDVTAVKTQVQELSQAAEDAKDLLLLCQGGLVDKIRHIVPFGGKIYEVDEFLEENSGLTVAEIELDSEDEFFLKPGWLSDEVTGDRRYYNSCLSKHPYSTWPRP